MKYPVFSNLARQDLNEIAAYISADNPAAAHGVIDAIESTALRITENSNIGKKVDSISRYPNLRFLPCSAYPNYVLFYQAWPDSDQCGAEVFIVRILHSARDRSSLL